MTDEQVKKYEEDCKNSGNLNYPLAGGIKSSLCKICKNFHCKAGTWTPVCLASRKNIPDDLLLGHTYKCDFFLHDTLSAFNIFFDENLNPLYR